MAVNTYPVQCKSSTNCIDYKRLRNDSVVSSFLLIQCLVLRHRALPNLYTENVRTSDNLGAFYSVRCQMSFISISERRLLRLLQHYRTLSRHRGYVQDFLETALASMRIHNLNDHGQFPDHHYRHPSPHQKPAHLCDIP